MNPQKLVDLFEEVVPRAFSLLGKLRFRKHGDQFLCVYASRILDLSESVKLLVSSSSPNGVYPIIRTQFEALCDQAGLKEHGETYKALISLAAITEKGRYVPLNKNETLEADRLRSSLKGTMFAGKKLTITLKIEVAKLDQLKGIYNLLCQQSHNNMNALIGYYLWEENSEKGLQVGINPDVELLDRINSMTCLSIWILVNSIRCLEQIEGFNDEDKQYWDALQERLTSDLNNWGS